MASNRVIATRMTDDTARRLREERQARRRRRRGTVKEPELPALPPPDRETLDELIRAYNLQPVGRRSSVHRYAAEVWDRRDMVTSYARAEVRAANSQSRLGQLWVVLNPLLTAAVFYLVFGVILQTSRGIENFIAFLVIGVFTMGYTTSSLSQGANSIAGNIDMVRAFSFPRMVLPVTVIVRQFLEHLVALLVMLVIVVATREPLTPLWLALPVIVFLQTVFNLGIALIAARYTSDVADLKNILPFFNRAWTYTSGVFFSIDRFASRAPESLRILFELNPANIYMSVTRDILMVSYTAPAWYWWAALAWAIAMLTIGYLIFWANEEHYGRG